MALFGGNNNEDKKAQKAQALMAKYGLEDLSDPRDLEAVKSITLELAGTKLMETGTLLSGSSEDVVKMALLRAITEQNWIIIRQLDKLINK